MDGYVVGRNTHLSYLFSSPHTAYYNIYRMKWKASLETTLNVTEIWKNERIKNLIKCKNETRKCPKKGDCLKEDFIDVRLILKK